MNDEIKNGRYEEAGRMSYYKDGLLHREDGPAREFENGDQLWFLNGKPHRVGGPAYDCKDGFKVWYENGELHREDGPAVIHPDGRKSWWRNGKKHREDGPAVESKFYKEWWLYGVKYPSEKEFPVNRDRVKMIEKEISTLDEEHLWQVANLVQKMIARHNAPDAGKTLKPKI